MHNKLLTAQDGRFSMSRRIVPIACTQNVQPHRYSAVLVRVMTTCIKNVQNDASAECYINGERRNNNNSPNHRS